MNNEKSELANGQLYVDLGLPSGLKWAKCNVGAKKETDYGDYYMWGSTIPDNNTDCSWINTPFNNGSSDYDAVYFNSVKDDVCPNGVLAKECDAAAQIMGDDWRTPTQSDFQELIDNTNSEWIKNFNGSGVNGRKFTSKTNGNSIFIPASGFRLDSLFRHQGSISSVWSSSLDPAYYGSAWCLYFDWDDINDGYGDRHRGRCVRGVMG